MGPSIVVVQDVRPGRNPEALERPARRAEAELARTQGVPVVVQRL
ncbi:hypothetical protein [Kitasatospora sp. NPDC059327]